LSNSKVVASSLICLVFGSVAGYVVSAFVYQPLITKLQGDLSALNAKYSELKLDYSDLNLSCSRLSSDYAQLNDRYSSLQASYSQLISDYSDLKTNYDTIKLRWDIIFQTAQTNYTSTTIVYYTNFGEDWNIMSVYIHYDVYKYYHEEQPHPTITKFNLDAAKTYITPNEPIIKRIVSEIKAQTKSEEELADALLDFVQYKSYALSNRYYYTLEYKYPIETLVEMGGDCDTHAFLYASLLKAAGFKIVLAFTSDMAHVGVAVHLTNTPTHNGQSTATYLTHDGVRYYYAETTNWGWMVGDMPPDLEGRSFYLTSI